MFNEKLRSLREAKGLTQVEVANSVGVSSATYSTYELGNKYPRADTLKEICLFFGVRSEFDCVF